MGFQKKIDAQHTGISDVESEVDWILDEVKAEELTFDEAESCLEELLARAPNPERDLAGQPYIFPLHHAKTASQQAKNPSGVQPSTKSSNCVT